MQASHLLASFLCGVGCWPLPTAEMWLGRTAWIALVAIGVTASVVAAEPTAAEIAAHQQSFEGYCQSVEDVLDTGAHAVVHDDPTRASLLLKWGREQGLPGLEGEIPLSRRRQALESVYREIRRRYPVSYTHLTLPTNREV